MFRIEKNSYIERHASMTVSGYIEASGRTILQDVMPGLIHELSDKLSMISFSTFEKMLMDRAYEKKLLLAYVKGEERDAVDALKKKFNDELLENGDAILEAQVPELMKLIRLSECQYIHALDEFCERFEKHKQKIEEVLLHGKVIHEFTELKLLAGDPHHHGRGTVIVSTDAGKFIYRPRDMQIDEISARFFNTFFPEVTALPETVISEDYGFCSFIENRPAACFEEAAEYYHNVGILMAVVLLLRSRDLHLENILASGTRPVPIDLEMMISPLESGVKSGASIKDVNWEETVLSSGFLSYRLGNFETGVLFSTDDKNMSMPVIDGKKVTVVPFKKELLAGFEAGYRKVLDQKEAISKFFRSLPPVKIRFLIRGTQAYVKLKMKVHSYQWIQDAGKKESIKSALESGFNKLGEDRYEAIVASETDALLEDNVPIFYALSSGHSLWDAEKCLYDDYFEISAVENVIRAVNAASERELQFETDLLEKAISRAIMVKDTNSDSICAPILSEKSENLQPEKLIHALTNAVIKDGLKTQLEDTIWFGVNDKYATPMSCQPWDFGMGFSGIAVFLSAACSISQNAAERIKLEAVCDKIMLQTEEMLANYLNMDGPYFENLISPCVEKGIGGVLLANELVSAYSGRPYCENIRNLCISILKKMDFTYSKNDMIYGLAGLVRVLLSFETLFRKEGIPELVERLCDLLLERREKLYRELLLWKSKDQNYQTVIAFPGYADGQAGIGAMLSLAGKKLSKKEYLDAAEMTAVFTDEMFDEASQSWQSLQKLERKLTVDNGILNGAAGIGFAMLLSDNDVGKRNLERAIKVCCDSELFYLDSLREGNCGEIDFLVEASEKLHRPELMAIARKKLGQIIDRAALDGDFHYIRAAYHNFFEAGMSKGAAGIGYTCLRCLYPEKIRSIFAL